MANHDPTASTDPDPVQEPSPPVGASPSAGGLPPARSREASYALSPAQEGMLAETLRAPGSGINIQQVVLRVKEELDVSALEGAWRYVIAAHPTLRTSFVWEGVQAPVQRVHSCAPLPLVQRDWREFPPDAVQQELNAFLRADRAVGFNLASPPLLRLAVLRLGPAAYDMVVTFHHLLLDGRSRRRLLAELEDAYRQIHKGRCPASREDRAYNAHMAGLDQTEMGNSEPFWQGILKGYEAPTPLGFNLVAQGQVRAGASGGLWHEQASLTLSEELTQTLRAALAQEHGLTLNTLVQGAWAVLLSRYSRATVRHRSAVSPRPKMR